MLATSSYLAAVAELLIIVAGALLGATALRRRLLPALDGPPAWLAAAVLAVALLLWTAELLGALGLFREAPLIIANLALGLGLHLGLRPLPGAAAEPGPGPAPDPGAAMRLAGIAIAALAIAHFAVGVRLRLGTGMTGFDSTWYHGPFAAGFAQSGDTLGIQFIAPQFLSWFYPQSSELLHGIGVLTFGRDLLSPLLNLGWLAGCLAAAWCIGRPFGAAPLSTAGVAIVLNSGALADQAGEARNDLMATFFLLAAVAMIVNALGRENRLPSGALAVVGIAAGIAAGTKLNFLVPAAALLGGLVAAAPASRRWSTLAAAGLPALAAGGFWYLRNLVHSGNPLPWAKEIGPIDLPSPDQPLGGREGHSVISYIGDGSVLSDWFGPGLEQGFGVLWAPLALAALAGLVLSLGRRAEPALRISALAGLALIVAWALAPTGASGPEGEPRGFVSGLRYLAPGLAVGMALLPVAPLLRSTRRRWALLAALLLLLPFVDSSAEPWHSAYLAVALAAGALTAAVALALRSPRLASLPRPALAAIAAAILAAGVVAGERGQRTYLDNRYAEPKFAAPGLNAAFAWAPSREDSRIATIATRQYPLFGTEISNEVQFVGVERSHAGFVRTGGCREFIETVNEIEPDYLVVSFDRLQRGGPSYPPEVAWTALSPAARVLLTLPPAAVFEISGRLDPSRCREETQ